MKFKDLENLVNNNIKVAGYRGEVEKISQREILMSVKDYILKILNKKYNNKFWVSDKGSNVYIRSNDSDYRINILEVKVHKVKDIKNSNYINTYYIFKNITINNILINNINIDNFDEFANQCIQTKINSNNKDIEQLNIFKELIKDKDISIKEFFILYDDYSRLSNQQKNKLFQETFDKKEVKL